MYRCDTRTCELRNRCPEFLMYPPLRDRRTGQLVCVECGQRVTEVGPVGPVRQFRSVQVPVVDAPDRLEVERLEAGFWRVQAHYGFMETPNILAILKLCAEHDLEFREMETTFFLSRETVIPKAGNGGMNLWQERLFAIMARNALSATSYFRLPANRVVELGMQVEI